MGRNIFDITREINELTLKMEFEYPELYRNIDEIPFKPKKSGSGDVDLWTLTEYLINLKEVLTHYKEAHQMPLKLNSKF